MQRAAGDRSTQAPVVDSMAVTKRSENYGSYVIHASAQPVAKQFQLNYRASAEIVKDGRRVDARLHRPTLWGARDCTVLCPGMGTRLDRSARSGGTGSFGGCRRGYAGRCRACADAGRSPRSACARARPGRDGGLQLPAYSNPSMILRSRTTADRLLPPHADGRGDSKPPELLFHA